jgi:hypothetical protein
MVGIKKHPCRAGPHGAAPRAPSPYPIFSSTRHRTPDPHPSPASASKGARSRAASHCTLFSSPPLVSVTRTPPFPASHPRWRPSHRGPHHISNRRQPPPPMVRPAYPPPFPYLGSLSPLSSSPAAPGASRSRRRPSLKRGPAARRRTEPPPRLAVDHRPR